MIYLDSAFMRPYCAALALGLACCFSTGLSSAQGVLVKKGSAPERKDVISGAELCAMINRASKSREESVQIDQCNQQTMNLPTGAVSPNAKHIPLQAEIQKIQKSEMASRSLKPASAYKDVTLLLSKDHLVLNSLKIQRTELSSGLPESGQCYPLGSNEQSKTEWICDGSALLSKRSGGRVVNSLDSEATLVRDCAEHRKRVGNNPELVAIKNPAECDVVHRPNPANLSIK